MKNKNLLQYKGYIAELTLDTEDDIIVGQVVNANDIISFHGNTVHRAKKAFHDVLDTYLETCHKKNIAASPPCSGKLSLRLTPDLHKKLRDRAYLKHLSLNELIIHILEHEVSHSSSAI